MGKVMWIRWSHVYIVGPVNVVGGHVHKARGHVYIVDHVNMVESRV